MGSTRASSIRSRWSERRRTTTLIQVMIAVDDTAKKEYPREKTSSRCKKFFRENQGFITRLAFGKLEIQGPMLLDVTEQGITLDAVLYKLVRCSLPTIAWVGWASWAALADEFGCHGRGVTSARRRGDEKGGVARWPGRAWGSGRCRPARGVGREPGPGAGFGGKVEVFERCVPATPPRDKPRGSTNSAPEYSRFSCQTPPTAGFPDRRQCRNRSPAAGQEPGPRSSRPAGCPYRPSGSGRWSASGRRPGLLCRGTG